MKIVIIEDEEASRSQLVKYIIRFDKQAEIIAELDSIDATILFFSNRGADIDLVISDIELRDGNIIAAWKDIGIRQPVIFITAYDKYWMDALRNSGIDYILKPFTYDDIERSMTKYNRLKEHLSTPVDLSLNKLLQNIEKKYKQRITYKFGDKIFVLPIASVMFFTIEKSVVFAVDISEKKHPLQYATLQELEAELNPDNFFRINRSDIIQVQYINQMKSIEGERTEIYLQNFKTPLYTSTNRNAGFKKWLELH